MPFLILLRPVKDNEKGTRSPSSPVAPNVCRIIGRDAANDSIPFLLQPNDSDEEEARLPLYPAAPDAHCIIGRGTSMTVVEKEVTGNHEVYPPPPLPAPARDVLVTTVSLPLSWSWIKGNRGDSQLVYWLGSWWRIHIPIFQMFSF